jgi:PAS domain S-box-containing protein
MNPSSFFRNRLFGTSGLFSLLCAGLVIFGVAGFICFRQFESAKTGALNADNTAAGLVATVLAEHEKASRGVLLSYAERPLLIKAVKEKDLAAVHSHMEGMKRNNPEVDLIFLTDKDATIRANYPVYPEAIGQNVSDRDWYRGVSARWEPYTSAAFQLIVGNKPLAVATAVPVLDEKGEVIGILGNSRRLDFMVSTVHNTYLNPDTTVNIIDQKGQLLFSNKYPFQDKIADYLLLPVVQQAIKGNEHLIEAPEQYGDGKSYLTWYPVEHVGWTVVVERRQEDILRSAYRGFFEIGAIAILLFTLSALFVFFHRKAVLLKKTEELLLTEKQLRESKQAELETRSRAEQEIKRLLASIREERDRLDSLISSISDEIWFADEKGRFALANPTAVREFGVDATSAMEVEKLISSLEILRPDGSPRPLEESPGLLSLTGKAVRNLEEIVRIPASGELRYRQVNSSPVRDAGGNIAGSVSVVRDITELKKAEDELRRSDATLRGMLEATQESIWLFSADGVVLLANKTALSRMGKTAEDVIGRRFNEILSADLARSRMARLRETVESGQPREFEDERGGVIFRHSFYPVFDAGGNVTRVVSFSRDITERKRAEQKLRLSEEALRLANESLEQRVRERTMDLQNLTGQLEGSRHELRKLASELVMAEERERKRIAGVLHDEIAQTLAAVRMRLELFQDIQADQKDKTLLDAKALLVQSIQETRALMNDLGNPLLFDMGLKAACEALAGRLMERHPVRIRCDIRDAYKHLDPDVKAILYQVVRELLNNVVKHSQAQNAQVMIDMESGHYRVKVTDDGVGFDPGALGAPTAEGGFGLYSIRERLIAIEGSLGIESTPGAGTMVTAILPASLN